MNAKAASYLKAVQALSPTKPILIWHGGNDRWHLFPCRHSESVWTCSILPSELFLDWDTTDWAEARRQALRVQAWAEKHGISVETAFSGSKSIHQSLYFDPATLEIPGEMEEDLKLLGADVAKAIREALLDVLVQEAGIDPVAGDLDAAKIRFSGHSKGSQKRIYESVKEGGEGKTWLREIPEERPTGYMVHWPPRLPELFSLEPWADRILARLKAEAERIRQFHSGQDPALPARLEDLASRPWWPHLMKPSAGLHDAALRALTLLMKDLGVKPGEVITFLKSWTPEGPCSSPSHVPGSSALQERVESLYRSSYHFSARRFQEELVDHGLAERILPRAAFLGIEGKRAWRFDLGHDILLRLRENAGRGWIATPEKDDEEGPITEIPAFTSRKQSGLGSKYYRERILEAILDLGALEDEAQGEVAKAIRQALNTLLKQTHRDRERLEGAEEPRPRLTPTQRKEARELLAADDFLEEIVGKTLAGIGLVGEENAGQATWVVTLTRFMDRSVNANLKADPGTGKNFVLTMVLELVPPEDVIHFDRVTANALFYVQEIDLRHKVLVIEEFVGTEDALYSLRTLQEKGELSILVTITKKGEAPSSHRVVVKGPCVVFTTTTEADLGEEEETRTFSLALDASETQTRAIIKAEAELLDSRLLLGEEEKEKVRNVQRLVRETLEEEDLLHKPYHEIVAAPWIVALGDLFPSKEVRYRRDYKRVANLVAAHAFLRAPMHKDRDHRGRVMSSLTEDYQPVRAVFNDFFRISAEGLHPLSREVLEATREIIAEKEPANPHETQSTIGGERGGIGGERGGNAARATVKRGEIAEDLGWHARRVDRWILPLHGRYLHVEKGGRGVPYEYSLRSDPGRVELPTYDAVRVRWLEILKGAGGDGE